MSMIERVALAIFAAGNDGQPYVGEDILMEAGWHLSCERAVTQARAAIEAMREPTSEVVGAVARRAWHSGSGVDPATVWAAGINAALEDK